MAPGIRRLRPLAGKDITEMYEAGLDLRQWLLDAIAGEQSCER
jgi:hypothetical protein